LKQRGEADVNTPTRSLRISPLWLCGRRLPKLNLIAIQVIDPGKAAVGFIHSFGVNLYSCVIGAHQW
jgi:hypothetical protein